jgi:D-3-phosphoglycerate dehydrogenase
MALMLAVARQVVTGDHAVRTVDTGFRYRVRFRELHGKTLGIVGFGRIGRRTAEIAKAAFAMRVLAYEREREPDLVARLGMERVERLEDLLAGADVVSLHLTLRPETRGIIGAAELARMKPTAILVNTARGGLIDEVALTEALREGRIAGAALDVVAHEPLASGHPLAGLANVVLSPHTGGATEEAMARTAEQVAQQVIQVLRGGKPAHLINPEVWERRRRPASP